MQSEGQYLDSQGSTADFSEGLVDFSPKILKSEEFNALKADNNIRPINNSLENHKINKETRSKLIDWIIEVLNKLNCSKSTFFLTVNIVDRYLKYAPKGLTREKMHIIGAVSMLIASKFQDVTKISIKVIKELVCHNVFTEKQLRLMEKEMVVVLNFELKVTVAYDLMIYFCESLKLPTIVEKIAEIILVLNTFDYSNNYCPMEEAISALFIAARSLNLIELTEKLLRIAESNNEYIEFAVISMQNMICSNKLSNPKYRSAQIHLGFQYDDIDKPSLFLFSDPVLQNMQSNSKLKFT